MGPWTNLNLEDVNLKGFGRKANITIIYGVKQTVKVFLELNIKYENVDNLFLQFREN